MEKNINLKGKLSFKANEENYLFILFHPQGVEKLSREGNLPFYNKQKNKINFVKIFDEEKLDKEPQDSRLRKFTHLHRVNSNLTNEELLSLGQELEELDYVEYCYIEPAKPSFLSNEASQISPIYIIDTEVRMSLIDIEGRFISSLFVLNPIYTVKIITSNGAWTSTPILLPPNKDIPQGCEIHIECNSDLDITVRNYINDSEYTDIVLHKGDFFKFTRAGSTWQLLFPSQDLHRIDTQAEMGNIDAGGTYTSGYYFYWIFLSTQSKMIFTITSDGNWLPTFVLPTQDVPHNRIMHFLCNSGYSITVRNFLNTSEYRDITLVKGEACTFIRQGTRWEILTRYTLGN